jgi:hypothetical protein
MRPFWRVMRRFCIVTLVAGVRALNLLRWRGGFARESAGISGSAIRRGGRQDLTLACLREVNVQHLLWRAVPTGPELAGAR